MPRLNSVPGYRLHKRTGQAVVTLRIAVGRYKDFYLGPYGSQDSKDKYSALIIEHRKQYPVVPVPIPKGYDVTVDDLIADYLTRCEGYYRHADGRKTGELKNIIGAMRPLHALCGDLLASEFGPKKLVTVRDAMIAKGWVRTRINQEIDRIRACFRWGVAEELVTAVHAEALRAVAPLAKGRSDAPESPEVMPVNESDYLATLPFLPPCPRAIVELMRVTGMRPGEACGLIWGEIDRTGEAWRHKPKHHKNAHRGQDRTIEIGPRGRAIITAYLASVDKSRTPCGQIADTGYVFCPQTARDVQYAAKRARRKTKVQPSQADRSKPAPVRHPRRGAYQPTALACAVRRAAEQAGVKSWHPNQIRHRVATEVREKYGLEASQVLLGHKNAKTTEIYAERDQGKAAQVAGEMG